MAQLKVTVVQKVEVTPNKMETDPNDFYRPKNGKSPQYN
jgi:hypothetical protein